MDLSKENPKTLATLVLSGNLQLGEIPTTNRNIVEKHVKRMKAEADEAAKKSKKKASTKKKAKEK